MQEMIRRVDGDNTAKSDRKGGNQLIKSPEPFKGSNGSRTGQGLLIIR